jgi:hypothetical protein
MREPEARIGVLKRISSNANAGTEILVSVPSDIVFGLSATLWLVMLKPL